LLSKDALKFFDFHLTPRAAELRAIIWPGGKRLPHRPGFVFLKLLPVGLPGWQFERAPGPPPKLRLLPRAAAYRAVNGKTGFVPAVIPAGGRISS
jgi:hypothetical protein